MERQVISISSSSIIRVVIIVAAVYALWQLSTLVLLVLSAVVIASAVEPGVEFFMRRNLHRSLSVILVYAILLALLVALVWFFVPPMLDEATILLTVLPQYVSQVENLTTLPFLQSTQVAPTLAESVSALQSVFSDTGAGVLRVVSSIFGGVFYLLLTLVVSIYFSFQETGVDDFLRLVTPTKHRDYVLSLWKRSHKKIGLWMQGQLLLSLIITILLFLSLTLLGVPYALLLAIFAGIMELIPVFGSFVAAVPGIAVALVSGDLTLALIVAGVYLIVNQFQAHLIYPLVVQKIVGVTPILVVIALIAGGQLAGFLGVLLSVPIAAVIQELVNDIQKHKDEEHKRMHART